MSIEKSGHQSLVKPLTYTVGVYCIIKGMIGHLPHKISRFWKLTWNTMVNLMQMCA